MNTFPNLAESFERLKLVLDLQDAIANNTDVISIGIAGAIDDDASAFEIIKYVRELSQDAPQIMEPILGKQLMQRLCAI